MAEPQAVYPIFLNHIQGALAVVVGGGIVGERKVTGLLATGAHVRVISPTATSALQRLAAAGQLEWLPRAYQPGDLAGALLAFAATNQRAVNAQVAHDARAARILCNVADAPCEGDFHAPAVHRAEGYTIAVGTGGRSPGLARTLRDRIAAWLADGG
ncbi:MAG: bifunctional precorrin-2 dehydrogenase/sirohydrochlorin ferrochelatase [Caldilineaceae bacterium]|nr:bifunctional precorrin-2 dehydrogenase/sirohydrochlorin ferrochelatase [Caldilineaceae bacterium]